MPEGAQLPIRRQPLEWLALPDRPITIDVLKHPAIEHEKSAVDPTHLVIRLLVKPRNRLVALDIEDSESARRRNGGHGRGLAVRGVKGNESLDVDVRDTVAVGEAEGIAIDELADPTQPSAGHRFE